MTMEQVNLQELQRLSDAINVTFEAIRRVAPQLQALQQYWLQQQIGFGQPFGIPQYGPQLGIPQLGIPQLGIPQYGIPQYGIPQYGYGQMPQMGYAQHFGWQQPSWGSPFGAGQYVPPVGVNPFVQRPF